MQALFNFFSYAPANPLSTIDPLPSVSNTTAINQPEKQYNLLSVDGGGVRCIMPLLILEEITERTQRAVHEIFDGFAGTSAGALILNALLLPGEDKEARFTPTTLLKKLETEFPKIFEESWWEEIESVGGLLGPKYTGDYLKQLIDEITGDALYKDQLRDIIVPSYNITKPKPKFFTREKELSKVNKTALKVSEVVLATSAAPTYFPPYELDKNLYVDGGVFANNPTVWGYSEMARQKHINVNQIHVLSLSTGSSHIPIEWMRVCEQGSLGWAPKILTTLFSAMVAGMHDLMQRFLTHRYHRIDIEIEASHTKLDDASKENLIYLRTVTKNWISENDTYLTQLCKELVQNH